MAKSEDNNREQYPLIEIPSSYFFYSWYTIFLQPNLSLPHLELKLSWSAHYKLQKELKNLELNWQKLSAKLKLSKTRWNLWQQTELPLILSAHSLCKWFLFSSVNNIFCKYLNENPVSLSQQFSWSWRKICELVLLGRWFQ